MPHPGQLHLVVPSCIVVKDGRMLILKRSEREIAFPGKWETPGGKLDRTEYEPTPTPTPGSWHGVVDATLRREILEEAGLEVAQLHFMGDVVFIRPDNLPVVVLRYWAKWQSGEVAISKDHTDFAWVKPDEASSYDLIEGIADEIEAVGTLIGAE